jgi:Cdc6-like AAA superfamily ATPase
MSVRKRNREGQHLQRKRAAKAKDNAREAIVLLEQARELIAEDDAGQPAIKHVYAAIDEAEGRATLLEDWYRRTYSSPAEEKLSR